MNAVKIIVLAMSRNIFNGIYFVLKSLEQDLERSEERRVGTEGSS